MQYRRLGSTGLPVSVLSLGSWVTFSNQVNDSRAQELMTIAYEAGVNYFDNAEVYAHGEAERIMGRVLATAGWSRDSYILSSKVMFGCIKDPRPTQRGLHRKHVVEACHQAMQRLQTDYLDLYFCHRPDPETPVAEVVQTMTMLIQQGKIMYWGTSEWSAAELEEAFDCARQNGWIAPAMEQPEYNLLRRGRVEVDYAPFYKTPGLGTTVWSPLASGLLTGKYIDGIPSGTRAELPDYAWMKEKLAGEEATKLLPAIKKLKELADGLGMTSAQLSLAWCIHNPHVTTAILGASRPQQLRENLAAVNLVEKLTPEILSALDAAFPVTSA